MRDDSEHSRYINPLEFHIPYFDIIAYDNDFIVELSETSDNRPYATISTTEIHTAPDVHNIHNHDPNELLSDTSESQVQYSQQSPQGTQTITHQPSNVQLEHLPLQPNENQDNNKNQDQFQNPNPTFDTQSTDITVDSNALLVPVRHVEDQNMQHNTEQDPQYLIQGSSTLSTTDTTIQQPPIQLPTYRNYDPPPIPESDTYTSSSTSHLNNQVPLITILTVFYRTHVHDLHSNLLQILKISHLQHIHIHQHKNF